MPPKTISAASMRAKFAANAAPKVSQKEREMAQAFRRFEVVSKYLQANGHDGKLILPLPRKTLGEHLPWYVESALKQQYADQCTTLLMAGLLPKPPAVIPQHVTAKVTFYLHSKMDSDNLHSRQKFIFDWIKGRYCVDDAEKYLAVQMQPQQICRNVPRVVIEITK